jgi:predicted aminopeptidase
VVTSDVDELAPLARLTVAEWCGCLRQAAAAGVTAVGDDTEVALRIEGGRIVARAVGAGAFPVYSSSGR